MKLIRRVAKSLAVHSPTQHAWSLLGFMTLGRVVELVFTGQHCFSRVRISPGDTLVPELERSGYEVQATIDGSVWLRRWIRNRKELDLELSRLEQSMRGQAVSARKVRRACVGVSAQDMLFLDVDSVARKTAFRWNGGSVSIVREWASKPCGALVTLGASITAFEDRDESWVRLTLTASDVRQGGLAVDSCSSKKIRIVCSHLGLTLQASGGVVNAFCAVASTRDAKRLVARLLQLLPPNEPVQPRPRLPKRY
jgi:hypothetical protein